MAKLQEGDRVVLALPQGDERNGDTATVIAQAGNGQYTVRTDSEYLDGRRVVDEFTINRVYLERAKK